MNEKDKEIQKIEFRNKALRAAYSEQLKDPFTQESKELETKVLNVYRFPNNMVCTFDQHGHQIPELQGVYSVDLHNKIKAKSDKETNWNGF